MMSEYGALLSELLFTTPEDHERTKSQVRTLDGTRVLTLPLPVIPGHRRYHPHLAAQELVWFLHGSVEGDEAPKFWRPFIEDDGRVPASYGSRWRKYHGFDQLLTAIGHLKEVPTDRRCWIDTWVPETDLKWGQYRSHPCLVGFNWRVVRGTLLMTCVKRSTDVIVGLPYDMMVMQMLNMAASLQAGYAYGGVEFVLMNPHCYEQHAEALEHPCGPDQPLFIPQMRLSVLEVEGDNYVKQIKQHNWHLSHPHADVYAPKLEVVV